MKWTQELRNKLYAVAGSIVAILLVVGVIDQATGDQALSLVNLILDNVESIVALIGLVTAFVKSLPSKVAVVEGVAARDVQAVITPDGTALAGPASDLQNGTPVGQVAVVDDSEV